MDDHYWSYETTEDDPDKRFGCVYARTVEEARRQAEKSSGATLAHDPRALEFSWFHYVPVVARPRRIMGSKTYSLRDQFFAGGRIGCEVEGFEIMFVPDLLPKPKELADGSVVYGNATIRVRDRPELDTTVELEGLDDAHLVDRLSSETARIVGRAVGAGADSYRAGQ